MKLYTVGYEGFDIEDFVSFLVKKGVRRIIDTRKNPISRKKGFSKNKLAEALSKENIDYFHLPGLGTPSAWRKLEQKGEISREKMFNDYVEQVLPKAENELSMVQELARQKRSALLCYEAEPTDCHRHFVAEELKHRENNLQVIDLIRPHET